MKFQFDEQFLLDCFRKIAETPSPVGYSRLLNPVLEEYAAMFGHTLTYDNKNTPYLTLEGEDNSKTVLIGAHADTIGLMVRTVDSDGMIRVRNLGGVNFGSLEG